MTTFYREFTSRNRHFISPRVQKRLSELRVLVAGCGGTGGAVIHALKRAGVQHFILADNGDYEISNLNRQHADISHLGLNKAKVQAREVSRTNPDSLTRYNAGGVHRKNVYSLVHSADIVFDAIDVTAMPAVEAKILLHAVCQELNKPVLTALDIGFFQWGCSYDYRNDKTEVLNGFRPSETRNPVAAVLSMYPTTHLPAHVLPMVLELLETQNTSASHLGCTSDALSAMIVPIMIKFIKTGELPRTWSLDLSGHAYTLSERFDMWVRSFGLRRKLKRTLKAAL